MIISKPKPGDAPEYCSPYFNLVNEDNLFDALENTRIATTEIIKKIPLLLENYSYQTGKWNLKMLLSHIVECERLYTFFAMCFSRGEKKKFLGINRELYAVHSNTEGRTLNEILSEYLAVRDATVQLFSYMTEEMLDSRCNDNEFVYTPRSLGWMVAGHNMHHCKVIGERYLVNLKI